MPEENKRSWRPADWIWPVMTIGLTILLATVTVTREDILRPVGQARSDLSALNARIEESLRMYQELRQQLHEAREERIENRREITELRKAMSSCLQSPKP